MVLFTLALTFGADMAANLIRRQLRHDPNHPRAVVRNSLGWQLGRKWAAIGMALALVMWSAWYQSIPHATVREPQLARLMQLFEPGGWRSMVFFERLLHPELGWEVRREGALVKSHFIGRVGQWDEAMKDAESVKNPALFAQGLAGKRLALGPVSKEPSHDGPRTYLENLAGKPLDEVFSSIIVTASDKETMLMVARGEADIGAIEESSFGPARKDDDLAPFMRRRAPVIDRAHSTDYYRAAKVEPGALPVSLRSALIPVGMAIIGTLLGVLAAMLLCYPHSVAFQLEPHRFTGESPAAWQRALRWVQAILARGVALTSRAIPEVMWAMFFVAFFGMGVVAGAFAIAIHSMGVLVRVFSETVDNIPYRRHEQAFGGSRVACFGYSAVPHSWHDWMTYSFFQLESNVRAGVVLGIIGSVGLGFLFSFNFEHFHYEKAATNLIVIILLTVVIDRISRLLKLTRVAT
ncbi:MAG: ABC transporter permease subunit [Planctomycetes bacterium]|nr:ABC transporter permease subunit [Planctomycetota bacterium]